MDDRTKEILQKIEEAEYVLVGLGQEFDMENLLEANPEYGKVREQLQKNNALWLLPYVEEQFRIQYLNKMEEEIRQGLNNLASVLEKKSYFVVSSSTSPIPTQIPWKKMLLKKERYVSPCGDLEKNNVRTVVRKKLRKLRKRTERIYSTAMKNCVQENFYLPTLGNAQNAGRT